MLRSLAIRTARAIPDSVKQRIHQHRHLSRFASKAFAAAAQADGKTARIQSGPLKGTQLVVSEHTSHAHLSGTYEIETQLAIDRYVKSGDVCYDLGASIGYLSLLMAQKANHVYAFEPAPHAVKEFRNHLAVNQLPNISILENAVSDHEFEVEFALTANAYGNSIARNETHWTTIKVLAITLDDFAKQAPMPDFIKIDVEGEEARVLKGAERILSEKKPIILCEVHSDKVAEEVLDILIPHGYSIKNLTGEDFHIVKPIIPGDVQIIALPTLI